MASHSCSICTGWQVIQNASITCSNAVAHSWWSLLEMRLVLSPARTWTESASTHKSFVAAYRWNSCIYTQHSVMAWGSVRFQIATNCNSLAFSCLYHFSLPMSTNRVHLSSNLGLRLLSGTVFILRATHCYWHVRAFHCGRAGEVFTWVSQLLFSVHFNNRRLVELAIRSHEAWPTMLVKGSWVRFLGTESSFI